MMPAGVWANEGNIPEKGTDNLFKINTVEEFKTFQNKVNRGGTDKVVTLSTNSNENEVRQRMSILTIVFVVVLQM